MGEDLSVGAGLSDGRMAARATFSPDLSVAEFASGAVIVLSTRFALARKTDSHPGATGSLSSIRLQTAGYRVFFPAAKCSFVESTNADRWLPSRLQFESWLARERISISLPDGMPSTRERLRRLARADAACSGAGLLTRA
jgi:hypothetical protein